MKNVYAAMKLVLLAVDAIPSCKERIKHMSADKKQTMKVNQWKLPLQRIKQKYNIHTCMKNRQNVH